MKQIYHQYLNNLSECHRLAKANRFRSSETEDFVLESIANNARQAYRLRTENDAILDEILFSRTAETLTPEDVAELEEFAAALLTFTRQDDAGIAYQVHQLLYEYAKQRHDLDLYIRELYHLGVSLYYLSPKISKLSINLNGKISTAYLREGAGYLARLEEIPSETTRAFVIRCLANLYLTDESVNGPHDPGTPYDRVANYANFKKLFDEIKGVLESPYYRELVPHFDWDSALHNLHFNRCLFFFELQGNDHPDIVRDILESAEYIYTHKRKTQEHSTKNARINYIYAAAKRRAGLADITEVVEVLINAVSGADKTDHSANGVTLNLQLPLYLDYTSRLLSEEQRKQYSGQIDRIVSGISPYLKSIPFNAYNNIVNNIIGETILYRAQQHEPLRKQFFHFLLCCHAPTYIHVRLTASLSKKLFLRMVDTAPEKLSGVFGLSDPRDITARKDELAQRIYDCSLYHDVGKIMLLDYVEIYSRRLLDEEFDAIRLHTRIGANLLRNAGSEELPYIALYHHCFHDLSGGYPQALPPCPAEYKPIVDIVSVSDSIEAATDNIGRCYSAPKSFETLLEELRTNCPNRYSADVVALFDDEGFAAQIKQELQQERRKTYIEIYREPLA